MRNSVSPGVSLFTHALSEFLHVWAGEEEEGEKENFFLFSIWMRRRRPFLSHTSCMQQSELFSPLLLATSFASDESGTFAASVSSSSSYSGADDSLLFPRSAPDEEGGGKSRQQRSSVGRSVKRQKRRRRRRR